MITPFRIFVVEDDPWYGKILHYYLSLNPDYQVTLFRNGKDCLAQLNLKPNLITVDYSLPDLNGAELFRQIKNTDPTLPVIIISAQSDIHTAVGLLKMGVSDYLVKDDNTKDLLWNAVIRIRETQSLRQEVERLRQELGKKYEFGESIKGNSPALKKTFTLIEKAAKTTINVSITGETGTGKELVAKAIHYASERKKQPFVAINMAAIPSELLESELFGYEKGAFTGAVTRKIGKFEEANKGTLFLDEIGELEPMLQSKLLRVLQEKELTRVGGNERVKLDLRLIVATHQNLAELVKKGSLREDFYYRIIGLPIELPPLRHRGNDILLLANFFLEAFAAENRFPPKHLTKAAKEKLLSYGFPGNVRELKAIIDLASVMSDTDLIEEADIRFNAVRSKEDFLSEEKTLKEYTAFIIQHYLQKYNNNVQLTATKLGIGKSTIYKALQEKEVELL
ncbi:sigma-54-dependent transcriptional regulator [Runella slithyformis]|uniref:Two component, sigma54 specific, transcriptional regulator, Fis family n=1 Tax=Runella slithyformis (strain ATCC 29530 / DSM 19594 / LMG 11500 / NCIMB 11436 / LSU 4) TaxID=761193 RepID=A0A7U3ZLZ5_RUNSL|nr:sigma-54 dependent transcriptional regulator [Runella slithyformis]AEI49681.1 two component, sigma54 specific, transcriptional regulator, Fis family [Runella slithyformis DSM 19594]